jgi:hypothetical protein
MENIEASNLIFSDSHGWSLTNNYPEGEKLLKKHNIENLSYGSDSYFDIYFKLKYLIDKNVKIDTIYLSVDPHQLGKKRVNNNNRNISITYIDYPIYNKFFELSYAEFFVRKHLRKYLSTFDVNNAKLIQKYLGSKISNNSTTKATKWLDLPDDEKHQKSINKFEDFYNKGVSKKQIDVVRKIFQLCEATEIKVIGVRYPYAPSLENLKIPQEFINVQSSVENNMEGVIEINNLGDEFFRNQDHVNNKGANVVINIIIKSI